MNDERLKELAMKVDAIIYSLCQEVDMQPLVLSGIVLARLTHLNDMMQTGSDFRKLADFIKNQPVIDYGENKAEDYTQANDLLKKFMKKDK